MVPVNQPLPPKQIDGSNGQRYQAGVNGPDQARPWYSMGFNKDNWTYFGTTGFPSSAGTYRGQMPPWRACQYVNSLGGNNAGTAGTGPAQRKTR